MSDVLTKTASEAKQPKQGRSAAYPGINLKAAVAKAKALYEAEGKYAVPMPSAFKAWGYGQKSSSGREARAALRYFGLITLEGDGETAKVKLTDDALRVLLDEREDQSEKNAIIRRLAQAPTVHKKLLEAFPDGIKSDATVEHYLMFEGGGYNKTAAGEIVAEFKETATYAGLYQPASIPAVGEGAVKTPPPPEMGTEGTTKTPPPPPQVKVGDYVQWTSAGVDQFKMPRKVVGLFSDGEHVQVFGSNRGIPMNELAVVPAPAASPSPAIQAPVETGSAGVQGENEFNVLQRGTRLQITADVDLEGLATLKEMLGDYESILKRLAGKKSN